MSNICKAFEMSDMNEQREHFSKLEIGSVLGTNAMERTCTNIMRDVEL